MIHTSNQSSCPDSFNLRFLAWRSSNLHFLHYQQASQPAGTYHNLCKNTSTPVLIAGPLSANNTKWMGVEESKKEYDFCLLVGAFDRTWADVGSYPRPCDFFKCCFTNFVWTDCWIKNEYRIDIVLWAEITAQSSSPLPCFWMQIALLFRILCWTRYSRHLLLDQHLRELTQLKHSGA